MHACLACKIIKILFKFCIPWHPLFLLWFSNHGSILGVDAKMTSVVECHFRVHIQYLVDFCLNITSIKINFDAFWNGGFLCQKLLRFYESCEKYWIIYERHFLLLEFLIKFIFEPLRSVNWKISKSKWDNPVSPSL